MLTRDQLLAMFRKSNALQRGHFELSSGLHSGHYFQCAQVLQYPKHATAIGRELARRFRKQKPTVVIGPAAGGILVAFEAARALGVRAMYSERVDAEMQLRRGFMVTKKDRVLITEDAITTGESARKVAALVERFGAKVVGIAAVVDRSGGRAKFPGKRFARLFSLAFETFPPHECPLCSEQIPVTRPGRIPRKTVL
ncbi:MAG: orotate phosphoribosyltransferase [Candidatus Omnitrophica bacterium]|nr:orotate phosphoribosyltransferase [Candidatus Omnitrophota bacterium]